MSGPIAEEPEPDDWPYDEDGVDRSLIRWMLSLSPTERLEAVQSSIELVASVRVVPDEWSE